MATAVINKPQGIVARHLKNKAKRIIAIALMISCIVTFGFLGAVLASFCGVISFGYLPGDNVIENQTVEHNWEGTELSANSTNIDKQSEGSKRLIDAALKEAELFTDGTEKDCTKYISWASGNYTIQASCAFVYYCADQCQFIGNGSDYCFGSSKLISAGDSWRKMQSLGYNMYNIRQGNIKYTPEPGDLVYYLKAKDTNIPANGMLDQMGIVKEVDAKGNLWTIEAGVKGGANNSDNAVLVINRTDTPYEGAGIFGFCHPNYVTVDHTSSSSSQSGTAGGVGSGVWSLDSTKDNKYNAYTFLRSVLGYNTASCAAIMRNIEIEDSTFNPTTVEGQSEYLGFQPTKYQGGFGLCQWTNNGDTKNNFTSSRSTTSGRCSNLKNWCDSNGKDWESLEGQLYFLKHELTEGGYESVHNYLLNSEDSETEGAKAGQYFRSNFEKGVGGVTTETYKNTYTYCLEYEKQYQQSLSAKANNAGGSKGITFDKSVLIIGDSNSVRWNMWDSRISEATMLAAVGMGVGNTEKFSSAVDETGSTVKAGIQNATGYKTAIIMLGTNNLGSTESSYCSNLKSIINTILNNNKGITINLCSIFPVWTSQGNVNNENAKKINEYVNSIVREYQAGGSNVQFIDVFSHFADSNGNMQDSYKDPSGGGYHVNQAAIKELTNFISSEAYK